MISRVLKSYFSDIPWVFNQTSLPPHYQNNQEIYVLYFIKELVPGMRYAFNSILESFAEGNLNDLESSLEPSLYLRVNQGLKKMKQRGMKFNRLHREKPEVTPLFVSFHSGVSLDRSKNPKENEVSKSTLHKEFKLDRVSSLTKKILSFVMRNGFDEVLKNTFIYGGKLESNVIASVDFAFHGDKFLGLDTEKGGLEYHVIKFETEVFKMDFTERIGNREFRYALYNKLYSIRPDMLLSQGKWIVSDIDNIMNGNNFLKSRLKK